MKKNREIRFEKKVVGRFLQFLDEINYGLLSLLWALVGRHGAKRSGHPLLLITGDEKSLFLQFAKL